MKDLETISIRGEEKFENEIEKSIERIKQS
jgi:hypothetical protein